MKTLSAFHASGIMPIFIQQMPEEEKKQKGLTIKIGELTKENLGKDIAILKIYLKPRGATTNVSDFVRRVFENLHELHAQDHEIEWPPILKIKELPLRPMKKKKAG